MDKCQKIEDCKNILEKEKKEISPFLEQLKNSKIIPSLVFFSNSYAKNIYNHWKYLKETCESLGIKFTEKNLDNSDTNSAIKEIEKFAKDNNTNGILIQLPLPKGLNINELRKNIPFKKDITFFTNIAKNNPSTNIYYNSYYNKTIAKIIKYYNIETENKNIVIVDEINDYVSNTSSILELLKDSKSNIKQCNLKIKNLKEICKNADILITNIGKNCFINEEYIKEQSIIIDISAKYTENGMIIGDVVTNDALEICNTIIQIPNIIEKVAPMLVIYKLILSII